MLAGCHDPHWLSWASDRGCSGRWLRGGRVGVGATSRKPHAAARTSAEVEVRPGRAWAASILLRGGYLRGSVEKIAHRSADIGGCVFVLVSSGSRFLEIDRQIDHFVANATPPILS